MESSCSSSRAWIVWIITSIFYAYQYILRVMPNILLGDIMQQFNIDAAVFGQFSGVYYIGYALMHIPLGLMLDRYGPRLIMTGCILLTVAGMLPLILASHWSYPIMGRALIGMGSSAAILGTFKIIRMIFSERRFSRMLSFSVTIGLIGAIYGGGPVSYLCKNIGYQAVVRLFAGLGCGLAILTYFIIPPMPVATPRPILRDIKSVLGNRRVVWACIFAGLMVGPLEGFADVWGTEFLKQVYGYESSLAASLPSLIFTGMCFGAPILSLIAEKSRSYLGTVVVCGVVMATSFFALISGQLSTVAIVLSFLGIGMCSAYQILAIYQVSTYVKEEVASLTTALANMIIMSFGYAFHTFIGLIINKMGAASASQAFVYGIALIPVTLMLASVGFAGLLLRQRSV